VTGGRTQPQSDHDALANTFVRARADVNELVTSGRLRTQPRDV
jgi:hypothetical protein